MGAGWNDGAYVMTHSRRLEAVFFDLGDTLIYFDGDWPEIIRRSRFQLLKSLQSEGLNLGEDFLSDFSERMAAYFEERNSEFVEYTSLYILRSTMNDWGMDAVDAQVLLRALAAMYEVSQQHWIPEDDALPTLKRLKEDGYRMALISNAADDLNTRLLVDKLGAAPYLEVLVSSAAAGIRKPNPRIFQSVLEIMNLKPQQAVMVGDSLGADILGAHNTGIFSVWITRRADTPANHAHSETIKPEAQIVSLNELPDLLAALEK